MSENTRTVSVLVLLVLGFIAPFLIGACSEDLARPIFRTRAVPTTGTNGYIHVFERDKPNNLMLLDRHPRAIEPELLKGKWLVFVYSEVSVHGARMALESPEYSRRLTGVCKVAVRPTRYVGEISAWLPYYDEEMGITGTLLLILDDGTLVRWENWRGSVDDVVQFARDAHAEATKGQDQP